MKLDLFAFFQKKKKPLPVPEIGNECPASSPYSDAGVETPQNTYDAEMIIGGLNWYRSQYQRAMKLALLMGGGVCLCICVIGALIWTRPTPRFFAATPDLRLAPLVPLDKPVLTQQGLLNWVSEIVTNAVSLDFLEWRDKLSRLREHFDEDAYKSFLNSLSSSGVLDMIRDKRLSVSAVVTRAPVIIASGLIGGKMTWRVEFPLAVSYESSQGVESAQKLIATVLIRRSATVTTPRGVVIQQLVLKRDS